MCSSAYRGRGRKERNRKEFVGIKEISHRYGKGREGGKEKGKGGGDAVREGGREGGKEGHGWVSDAGGKVGGREGG